MKETHKAAHEDSARLALAIMRSFEGVQVEVKVTGEDGRTSAVVFAFDRRASALVGERSPSGIFHIDEVPIRCGDHAPSFEEAYERLMGKKPWGSW